MPPSLPFMDRRRPLDSCDSLTMLVNLRLHPLLANLDPVDRLLYGVQLGTERRNGNKPGGNGYDAGDQNAGNNGDDSAA